MNFDRVPSSAQRHLSLLTAALLVAIAMLMAMASDASALSLGLQWSGSYNDVEDSREMDVIQKSGAKFYRLHFHWGMQVNEGNWNLYDRAFELAAQRDITILPYFNGSPNGTGRAFPKPSEYPQWDAWITEAVGRYGDGGSFWTTHPQLPATPATVWEVWNEPNLVENNPIIGKEACEKLNSPYKSFTFEKVTYSTCVQARAYGEFLVHTAALIKAGHPERKVLFGGLFMPGSPAAPSYQNYLEKAYEAPGLASAYDSLAIHPYAFTASIAPVEGYVGNTRSILDNVLNDKGKSIWITEMGWAVGESGNVDGKLFFEPGQQASLLTSSINWVKSVSATKNVQGLIWYSYRDINVPGNWAYWCGLRKLNGDFRPAWSAFQSQTGAPTWPRFGSPSALQDAPNAGQREVYHVGADDSIKQWFFNGTQWFNGGLGTGAVAAVGSSPVAIRSPTTKQEEIYYVGTDGAIKQWFFNGTQWFNGVLGAGATAATGTTPAVLQNAPGTGQKEIYYVGTDGAIRQWFFNGTQWFNGGLGAGARAALGASPVAVRNSTNKQEEIYYVGTDGAIKQWFFNGTQWFNGGLGAGATAATGTIPAVLQNSPGPGQKEIYYTGADGAIKQWFFNGTQWFNGGLGAGAKAASGSSPVAIRSPTNKQEEIYYVGTDGAIKQWFFNGTQWFNGGLGAGATAAPGTTLAILQDAPGPGQREIYYVGSEGAIKQWFFNGTQWFNGGL